MFNGISAPLIEAPINDEIRDTLNPQYAFKSFSVLVKEKDEVWMFLPIGSQETGETVYKFNYVTRNLYKDTRELASAAWLGSADSSLAWDDIPDSVTWDNVTGRWDGAGLSQGADQINISDTLGYTSKVDGSSLNDSGTTIEAKLVTKLFEDTTINLSRWQKLELWAKGGTVNVDYSTDEGTTWTSISGSPFTLDNTYPTGVAPLVMYFDIISQNIQFRFSNNESDETLEIKQFVVYYRKREERQS